MYAPHAAPVTVISHALLPPGLAQASSIERQSWLSALPDLATLRQAWVQRQPHDPQHLDATHEWALAQSWGTTITPGLLGWAAQTAAQQGWTCPNDHGWAFIDLVHWHVEQGQVQLHHPGPLSSTEEQALFASMSPYFLEDGIHLKSLESGRWLAHSRLFKNLPSASLDQVRGRAITAWLDPDQLAQQSDAQRVLRRLQNEMQMLLYTHAVNEHRALSLNSFWWSGTGEAMPMRSNKATLRLDLRDAYLSQDVSRWGALWQSLAQDVMLPALKSGEGLVLCGEHHMVRLQSPPDTWLQRFKNCLPRPALPEVLS